MGSCEFSRSGLVIRKNEINFSLFFFSYLKDKSPSAFDLDKSFELLKSFSSFLFKVESRNFRRIREKMNFSTRQVYFLWSIFYFRINSICRRIILLRRDSNSSKIVRNIFLWLLRLTFDWNKSQYWHRYLHTIRGISFRSRSSDKKLCQMYLWITPQLIDVFIVTIRKQRFEFELEFNRMKYFESLLT